jgi:SNF2 family DNA or RNA helicase
MPDYLGDYELFKAGFEEPIAGGGPRAEEAQAKLKRKLHPFILRRLKKTVAQDLPDKLVKVTYCQLPDDVRRDYLSVLQKERRGAKTKFEMLALLMKLRQIASRGKTEAFLDQLDEAIRGGHRVLVFSQFVKQLAVLKDELSAAGIPFCYLDGSTKDRLGECNRFNRTPDIPVFLISLMAGGTGLNLTGADMVMHYDPWWNPAVEDQATDRAHRIGQKKKVYVVKFIAADTIEEKVLALQRRKQAVIAATVSTSDAAIVEKLTTDDLAELLS